MYSLLIGLLFVISISLVGVWFYNKKINQFKSENNQFQLEIQQLKKTKQELEKIKKKEELKKEDDAKREKIIEENNQKVLKFIKEKIPQIVIITSAGNLHDYKLYKIWHETLKKLNLPFFVFVTNKKGYFNFLQNIPGLQIVCGSKNDIKKYVSEQTKIFLYPFSFAFKINSIRLFPKSLHIFIGHGDSEKRASAHKALTIFDQNWVAGPRSIQRFQAQKIKTLPDYFKIIGRPTLSEIQPTNEEQTIRQLKNDNSDITFLYAPTFRGIYSDDQHSSIENSYQIVKYLISKKYKVIFRPHPALLELKKNNPFFSDTWEIEKIKDLLKNSGNQYSDPYAEKPTLVDLINQSDVIITDISSVVSESLLSRKPILINSDTKNTAEFEKNYEIARFNYVIDQDLGNLGEVVEEVLTKDPKRKARVEKIPYYLGSDDPKKMFPMFEKAIQEALKESQA